MTDATRPPTLTFLLTGLLLAFLPACGPNAGADDEAAPGRQEPTPLTLGPKDGSDLSPTDLERVAVGSVAPDFSLRTLAGDTLTLSDFRGKKDVILVFYRGHW
jgi:hypothetical protein